MKVILIADSGSTKTEWCLLRDNRKKRIITQGLSPYFLNEEQISEVLNNELMPKLKDIVPDDIFLWHGLQQSRECKYRKKSHPQAFKIEHKSRP